MYPRGIFCNTVHASVVDADNNGWDVATVLQHLHGFVDGPLSAEGGGNGIEEVLAVVHVEDGEAVLGGVVVLGEVDPDPAGAVELGDGKIHSENMGIADGGVPAEEVLPVLDGIGDGKAVLKCKGTVGTEGAIELGLDTVPIATGVLVFYCLAGGTIDGEGVGAIGLFGHLAGGETGIPTVEGACNMDGIDEGSVEGWGGHEAKGDLGMDGHPYEEVKTEEDSETLHGTN